MNLQQPLVDEETDARTGIGRVYYGVFLNLREEILKFSEKLARDLQSKSVELNRSAQITNSEDEKQKANDMKIRSSVAQSVSANISMVIEKKDAIIHRLIIDIARICNFNLGNLIFSLRDQRNSVDYDLNSRFRKGHLDSAIQTGQSVLADYYLIPDNFENRLTKISEQIKTYQKKKY